MHNCHDVMLCVVWYIRLLSSTSCQENHMYHAATAVSLFSVKIRSHPSSRGWAVTVRFYGISQRSFALCRLSLETHPLCRGLRQVGGLSGRRLPEWSYPRMHGGATSSYLLCTTHIHRVFNEQISRYGPAETRSVSLCNVCRMSGLHRHLPLHAALPPSRQIRFSLVPYGFNATVVPASPVHLDRQVISSYGYLLVNILS